MDSIIQRDKTRCFICGMNSSLEPLDCHHIYGNSNRNNSEKYGLKVYIHHSKCHIFGEPQRKDRQKAKGIGTEKGYEALRMDGRTIQRNIRKKLYLGV